MIRAVLFDLDGTLLDRDAAVELFIHAQYDSFSSLLTPVSKEEYTLRFVELDAHGYMPKDQVYKQLLSDFGVNGVNWTELFEHYLAHLGQFSVPFPNAVAVLERLRKRNYLLGIITNGSVRMQMSTIKGLGIESYMHTITISEREHIKKPDVEIFRLTAARLGLSREQCVFVGDHPVNDVQAARNAGMKAVWKVNHVFSEPEEADLKIDSLEELIPYLSTNKGN